MNLKSKSVSVIITVIVIFAISSFTEASYFNTYLQTNFEDTIIKKFTRHNGLLYIDKKVKKKIISREVYSDNKLVYKYPITRENIVKGTICLGTGNNFLIKGLSDTIYFKNYVLPITNRLAAMKGGQISRLTDTSYIVRSNSSIGTSAVFILTASDNFEEIKNRETFIVDSIVLSIK